MISVTVEQKGLTEIRAHLSKISRGDLPNLKRGVKDAAEFVTKVWRSVVATGQLIEYDGQSFSVHRRTGNYERNVNYIYPYENDLSALIVAEAKYADAIENGVKPYDMKPGLLKGRQYVRIPFRHAVPGQGLKAGDTTATGLKVMSQQIYNLIKKAGTVGHSNVGIRSKVVSTIEGNKLTYSWKTGMYAGMRKSGAAGHGQYYTFRTVSVRSDPNSWWHPGTPPRPISKAIAESTKDEVREILSQSLLQDIEG